jgi:hypothetical protein
VIYQTFLEMEKANVKGDDKFFHCTAMARASSLGPGGVGAAITASWGREITDTFKYRYYLITGNPHGLNFRDSIADSKDDLRADYAGINGGLSGCTQYRVRGLP